MWPSEHHACRKRLASMWPSDHHACRKRLASVCRASTMLPQETRQHVAERLACREYFFAARSERSDAVSDPAAGQVDAAVPCRACQPPRGVSRRQERAKRGGRRPARGAVGWRRAYLTCMARRSAGRGPNRGLTFIHDALQGFGLDSRTAERVSPLITMRWNVS